VNVGLYSTDPVAALGTATDYFDVSVAPGSSFSVVTFQICGVAAATSIQWWNPVSASWQTLSGQTPPQGTPACITVTVTNSSVPSIAQLYGTIFAVVRSHRAPAFISPASAAAAVGHSFNFTVQTSGYPIASISESGVLAKGLTFTDHHNGTATISGTPAFGTGGRYPLTFKAANSSGSVTQAFTLTVGRDRR